MKNIIPFILALIVVAIAIWYGQGHFGEALVKILVAAFIVLTFATLTAILKEAKAL